MSVVVDASLIVALVVADHRQGVAASTVARWLEDGEELHAPAVLPYEVANVLARRTFDGHLDPAEVDGIWTDLDALGLLLHPFDFIDDGTRVAAITRELRRRHATDSTYISLARRLGAVVWTLDESLARGAGDLGLPVQLLG